MKRFPFLLAPLTVLTTLLAGCATVIPDTGNRVLTQIDEIIVGSYQTRPVMMELDGKLAVLHSTKSNRVALQIGGRTQLLDETARVKQGGSYFQLNQIDQSFAATWWSHQDGKNIYFTSTKDGGQNFSPVSMVNSEHGVLVPYSLVSGPQGELGMAYHDERQPNYQVYFNRSSDYGRTWRADDKRLDTPPTGGRTSDAHEPQIVQSGAAWVSVWTELMNIDGKANYRVVTRRSEDAGQTWAGPKVLYNGGYQFSSLIVRAKGDEIVIAADELQHGVFALSSQDQGVNWRNTGSVAGSENVSNSGIDMTVSNGRAHLVWNFDQKDEKTHIMHASVDIASAKWLTRAQRLDVKEVENTRSITPVILATKQGVLISAWVDFRDIRPNVYLSASYNEGQTWALPKPLGEPGAASLGWPQLATFGDQAVIGYEIYPTDRKTEGKFIAELIPAGTELTGLLLPQHPAQVSEADRKAKLERRVNELWGYRVAGDYSKAYDMFDFVYRSMTPKANYLNSAGAITFLQSTVVTLGINGNEAFVNMKLKYEMKPTMTPFATKPISVAPIEVDTPTTWVWVGSDWYLVYTPSFEPQPLKY